MPNAINCYVVSDDLLILVPDTSEMADRIYRHMGPPPDGVKWIVLAPGSTVTDLRGARAVRRTTSESAMSATDYTLARLRGER